MFNKTCIGKLYTKIDPYLSERKFRPDNAYWFVDRLVCQSVPDVPVMHHQSEEQYSTYDHVRVENSVLDSVSHHILMDVPLLLNVFDQRL